MPKKGKLIVIDGTDGSGKTTQAQLLIERLKNKGVRVASTDFPQYGKKSAGPIEEYLNGNYGTANEVGPYRASIFYAIDRYDASFQMRKNLDEGQIIISNRYVSASMGHQASKISDQMERKKYLEWLFELEYGIFGIPKPDITLILHVPTKIAFELIAKKDDRAYLNGKKRDIHEEDKAHLEQAESAYLAMAEQFPDFALISCVKNEKLLSKEEIAELIWQKIEKIISATV